MNNNSTIVYYINDFEEGQDEEVLYDVNNIFQSESNELIEVFDYLNTLEINVHPNLVQKIIKQAVPFTAKKVLQNF